MSKFGEELIREPDRRPRPCARRDLWRAHSHGGGSRRAGNPPPAPYVSAGIRRHLRIPLSTLKNWEQGRRHPDAPAAAYLQAIDRRPREISSALIPDPT